MKLSAEQIEDAGKMASKPDLPNFSLAGTGKTHTTLEAIRLTGFDRHLIVAPPIAVSWWVQQAQEFLGADARAMRTADSPLAGDILVTTYGIARNARERIYDEFRSGSLTLDESHYLCNGAAKQTQAIFGNRLDLAGGLAERFDTVWPLSGTPKRNHADDYYTQVATLHPEVFAKYGIKDYEDFTKKFTRKAQRQFHPRMQPVWKIVASANEALLGRIIYDEIGAIRRLEAPGLPKLRYRELSVKCRLSKELKAAMKGIPDDEIIAKLNEPDGIIAKAWKGIGIGKVDQLVPYIGDSAASSPVLLGCWHHEVMDLYSEKLDGMGLTVVQVSGKTPSKQRDSIRDRFNNGEIDVLIGQMAAMGVSWNLQEASNHVIIAEEYPSPGVIEQFYKRVYRRGQGRDCTVDLVLGDGMEVDTALNNVRKRKEESNDKIG